MPPNINPGHAARRTSTPGGTHPGVSRMNWKNTDRLGRRLVRLPLSIARRAARVAMRRGEVASATALTTPISSPPVDPADNAADPRNVFIKRVAEGKSFIDIGGLSEVVYERVSVAHAAGARDLALMDVEGPSCPWWPQVRERLTGRGVGECKFISGDIMTSEVTTYDVVYSSGVLYHLPSPVPYLARLRQMTRDYCILTSTTVPTRLTVDREKLQLPSASMLVIPALAGRERQLVVEWFKRRGRDDVTYTEERFGGLRNLTNYYPNWFIPTVAAFKAMAICAGFAIVDEGPVEADDLSYCLLLRPD